MKEDEKLDNAKIEQEFMSNFHIEYIANYSKKQDSIFERFAEYKHEEDNFDNKLANWIQIENNLNNYRAYKTLYDNENVIFIQYIYSYYKIIVKG